MKEQAIERFLNEITNGIISAKEFASAQLPDFLNQVLRFQTIEDIVFILICLLCLGLFWRIHKFIQKENWDEMAYSWLGILAISVIIFMCFQIHDLILITSAPKVWSIEYLAHLVHGGCGCGK